MALNHSNQNVQRVVLDEVDIGYIDVQVSRVTDILQNPKYPMTQHERMALDGIRNLLCAIMGTEPAAPPPRKHKRFNYPDVNRARDLHLAGKSAMAIADQLGYSPVAVARVLDGKTHTNVAYEPSEFAVPIAHQKRPNPWLLKKGGKA